jgi:hypothetical protein
MAARLRYGVIGTGMMGVEHPSRIRTQRRAASRVW